MIDDADGWLEFNARFFPPAVYGLSVPCRSETFSAQYLREAGRYCDLFVVLPPGLAGPAAYETFAILLPRRRHRGR